MIRGLEAFSESWNSRYPQISWSWLANWDNRSTFFAYPMEIRKVIYTTNTIESLNSVIRHAVKKRKAFPSDDSARKVIWLAIMSGLSDGREISKEISISEKKPAKIFNPKVIK